MFVYNGKKLPALIIDERELPMEPFRRPAAPSLRAICHITSNILVEGKHPCLHNSNSLFLGNKKCLLKNDFAVKCSGLHFTESVIIRVLVTSKKLTRMPLIPAATTLEL